MKLWKLIVMSLMFCGCTQKAKMSDNEFKEACNHIGFVLHMDTEFKSRNDSVCLIYPNGTRKLNKAKSFNADEFEVIKRFFIVIGDRK